MEDHHRAKKSKCIQIDIKYIKNNARLMEKIE
jgi:hypothetical protein